MSELIESDRELKKVLESREKACILFYASWCPHSRRFLPIFEKHAGKHGQDFVRCMVDNDERVCDRYSVSVYPSVIFFENGKVSKRLDGVPGVGLDEDQLTGWIAGCGL
jgi:thioredoxin-like negative regulator of GroEL